MVDQQQLAVRQPQDLLREVVHFAHAYAEQHQCRERLHPVPRDLRYRTKRHHSVPVRRPEGVCTPSAILGHVANQPKTPHRTIRVPDELWEAAKRKAADEGVSVTEVIVRLLTRWVNDYRT